MRDNIDYIYLELSEKYNVPIECIEQLEKDWWKSVKKELGSKSGKDIIIPSFGTIYIRREIVDKRIASLTKVLQDLELKFKNKEIDWMPYLYKWRDINYMLASANLIKENLLRRDGRQKWERGI